MKTSIDCTPRKVVLRRALDADSARATVEAKKTSAFRSFLSSPKKADIHTHSVRVAYEATTVLAGTYRASYYRRATHAIRVDHNVRRVELGGGVFEVKSKSKIRHAISGPKAKNRVELDVEEYVVDEQDGRIHLDHHGREVRRFAYKLGSGYAESYPSRVLGAAEIVREPELKLEALVARLCEKLVPKPALGSVRDLKDQAVITKITHVYVPVIEAKLVGPKKRIRMLRIDGVTKKILKA